MTKAAKERILGREDNVSGWIVRLNGTGKLLRSRDVHVATGATVAATQQAPICSPDTSQQEEQIDLGETLQEQEDEKQEQKDLFHSSGTPWEEAMTHYNLEVADARREEKTKKDTGTAILLKENDRQKKTTQQHSSGKRQTSKLPPHEACTKRGVLQLQEARSLGEGLLEQRREQERRKGWLSRRTKGLGFQQEGTIKSAMGNQQQQW
jgi:hypothetical protein